MNSELLYWLKRAGITRHKDVALYSQIREALRACIVEERVAVGDQLPSETDLAEALGVSHMTVRRALSELADDGMVRRIHGLGTIVSSRKVVRNYNRLTSFHEEAQNHGLSPTSRLVTREVIEAPRHIAEALEVAGGSPLIHLTRLRLAKKRVISLHEVYVSEALCPWLLEEDLENQSIYQLYADHDLPPEWGHQRIEARVATGKQASLLEISTGDPVLCVRRTTYTLENVPIEWMQSFSPGGLFAVEMTLRR